MEIKHLKSYVTVADCKSFSRAAQILYISQPSISTHISIIEQEIGEKLIERTSKSLALTESGKKFYEYAVNILKLSDKMVKDIGSVSAPCIHIGASTVPSVYLLPDILFEYNRNNKNCSFSVKRSDSRKVIDGILEGIFDVGFTGADCNERGVESHVIARDEMVIIMPDTKYYRSICEDDSENLISRFIREPFIVREEGSGSGEMFNSMLLNYNLNIGDVNVVARVDDHETIINMVERGLGVACVSSLTLNGGNRKIIEKKLPDKAGERLFYMVYKSSSLRKELISDFINHVCINNNKSGVFEVFGSGEPIKNFLKLWDKKYPVISVVGAGGKSTVIEAIADEYVRDGIDVIITTTTKIRQPQRYYETLSDECLRKKEGEKQGRKIYLGTGVTENGIRKLKGPGPESLARLISERRHPILIEADGSKGKSCKAPTDYEPVIRPETDIVIAVISNTCLNRKIMDVCHRPDKVSLLLHKGKNDIITDKDLEVIFNDSNGLKKGVTQKMKYIPILRVN